MYCSYFKALNFSILVFTSAFTFAQNNYRRGYIVLTNKDTLNGYVFEQMRYTKAVTIPFRKDSITSAAFSYAHSDILGFTNLDTEEIYVTRVVDIDKKPIEPNRLENNIKSKIENERVFLKVLVRGKVDLLQYYDENNKVHFYYAQGDTTTELGYLKFLSNYAQIAEISKYKTQLKMVFSDYPKLANRNYSYTQASLSGAFKEYNEYFKSLSYYKRKEKSKVILAMYIGMSANQLTYEGRDNFNDGTGDYASTYNYSPTLNPIIGATIGIESKKKFNPFKPNFGIYWRKVGTYTASNNVTEVYNDRKDYSIDLSLLNIHLGVQYSFVRNSLLSPYLRLGVGYCHILNINSSMTKTSFNVSQKLEPLVNLSTSGINVATSLGCSLKHFQFEFSYDMTKLSGEQKYDFTISSASFTIGYMIVKSR